MHCETAGRSNLLLNGPDPSMRIVYFVGDCFAQNARNYISNGIIEHMTTNPSTPPTGAGRTRPLDPESKPDDRVDNALRPQKLTDLIGQDQVKENLSILIAAARKRGEALGSRLVLRSSGSREDNPCACGCQRDGSQCQSDGGTCHRARR